MILLIESEQNLYILSGVFREVTPEVWMVEISGGGY